MSKRSLLLYLKYLIDMGHEIIANTRHEQDSFQRQAIEANHVLLALALDLMVCTITCFHFFCLPSNYEAEDNRAPCLTFTKLF